MTMRTKSSLFMVMLAIVVVATGCGSSGPAAQSGSRSGSTGSTAAATGPKRVVAGIPSNPPMLYNKLNVGGVGGQGAALQDLVHVGLTAYDTARVLQPRLAEQVPSIENGLWRVLPDGRMETTWRIRPNAMWHDGKPFTSDDLAFTLDAVRDRELPALADIRYTAIEGVEAPDSRTFTIRWSRPFIEADAMFSADLAAPMPKHLLEQPYSESKAAFGDLAYWGPEFVGAGPFKVRDMQRGTGLVVDAFDQYVLGRPKVDQVEVRFILNETTLVAGILAGAIELTLARSVSAEQGVQLRDEWKDGRMELLSDDWYVMYPQFVNPNPSVIRDLRFRRALMQATNRQQMADTLEGGLSAVAESFVHPRETEYKDVESSLVRYAYDPRRAVEAIEELGFTKGPDRMYQDPSGQRLEISIYATQLDAHQKMVFTLNDEWPALGIGVDPVIIPPQRAQDAEYRATFPGFSLQGHPRNPNWFYSSEARLPEKNFRGSNNARYMSAELDGHLDRFFSTVPKAERVRALAQIVNHLSDQLVVLPLIWRVDPTMVGNRLVNVGGRGRDATQAWNAHEWDVKS